MTVQAKFKSSFCPHVAAYCNNCVIETQGGNWAQLATRVIDLDKRCVWRQLMEAVHDDVVGWLISIVCCDVVQNLTFAARRLQTTTTLDQPPVLSLPSLSLSIYIYTPSSLVPKCKRKKKLKCSLSFWMHIIP